MPPFHANANATNRNDNAAGNRARPMRVRDDQA